MSEATRELRLKLTVDAPDPSKPSKAFQDIAAQANKASLAVQDANRQMQRMQGPGNGPGGGLSSSANSYYDRRLAREQADVAAAMARGSFAAGPGSISWSRPGFTGAASASSTLFAPTAPTHSAPSIASVTAPSIAAQVAAGSAIQGRQPRTTSNVSAFDRPQAVVIVGPRPLAVAVVSGMPGGSSDRTGGLHRGPAAAKTSDAWEKLQGGLTKTVGVVAGVAVAASAFGAITEAAAKMNDPLATSADRLQTLAKAVPLFGDSLASMLGSVTSAVGRLQNWEGSLKRDQAMREHPLNMAKQQLQFEAEEKGNELRRRARDAGDALDARKTRPSVAAEMDEKLKGMSGFGGLLQKAAWENKDDRLKGAMEAVRDAERALSQSQNGIAGAKVDQIMAAGKLAEADANAEAARRSRELAGEKAGVGSPKEKGTDKEGFSFKRAFKSGGATELYRSGAQDAKAKEYDLELRREEAAIAKQQEALRLRQAAEERLGQKSLEVAQRQYELEKKRIDLQKTRVELLQEEYQRSQAASRSFASMDEVSQRGVLDDIEQFKKFGREGLGADQFQRLQSLAPDLVAKSLDEQAKKSPLMKEFMDKLGLRDSEVIQKELKPLKAELSMKVEFNERQYLEASKKAADELRARLEPLLKAIADASGAMYENKFKQQNRGAP